MHKSVISEILGQNIDYVKDELNSYCTIVELTLLMRYADIMLDNLCVTDVILNLRL